MGLRIPQIERIDTTSNQPQNQRINLQVQDNASLIQQRTQQVNQLVENGADLYQDFEDSKIKQLSYETEQEYKTWNDQQLANLKTVQGDPTEAYREYEQASQEKFDEIMAKHGDVTDRVKRNVQGSLAKTSQTQRAYALKQRNAQVETYKNNLYESQLKLKSDTMSDAASFVQPGNLASFVPLEQNIKDTRDIVVTRAYEQGLAEKLPDDAESFNYVSVDANGKTTKYKINDIAEQRMAVELSKGVSQSVDNLIASGYNDRAKAVFDRYEGYIDTRTKTKLQNKFEQADVEDEAYSKLAEVRTLPPEEQLDAIEKETNLEVRSKMLQIKDADDRRIENMKDRQQKANYERLSTDVFNKMNSNQPFFGLADLQKDPTYKATFDKLSDKQKKAIEKLVEPPTKSSVKKLVRVQNDLNDPEALNKIAQMSDAEFYSEYLAGLKSSDVSKYNEQRQKILNPSNSQRRAALNFTNQEIKKALKNAKIISNKGTFQDDQLTAEAFQVFSDYQESLGRPLTPDETIKISKKIAADALKTKTGFFGGTSQEFIGFQPVKQPAQKTNGSFKFENSTQRRKLKQEYKELNNLDGRLDTNDKGFQDWLRNRGKRLQGS